MFPESWLRGVEVFVFCRELIYKNIIFDSDTCSFMLHFQFTFLGVYILKRFKELISIVNDTEFITNSSCFMIFIHSWWSKKNYAFNQMMDCNQHCTVHGVVL